MKKKKRARAKARARAGAGRDGVTIWEGRGGAGRGGKRCRLCFWRGRPSRDLPRPTLLRPITIPSCDSSLYIFLIIY